MKKETRRKLINAWIWCDSEDKSTEFTFQFMADTAHVQYDRAVEFMMEYTRTEEDFRIYNRKETYTREEVFEMLSEVAETLTFSKDPFDLVTAALTKIQELGKKLE
jgi:hypothetical protein